MAHAISRIYATKADADSAIGDLGKHGFDTGNVFVVDPPAVPVDPSSPAGQSVVEQIADKIAKGFILKRDAKVYAKHVAKGAVFVTVYAPFGAGRKMTVFLDSHRPVDPGFPPPAQPRLRYDEATPLSCALGLPVLASHPTPCSAVLGLPAISVGGRALSQVPSLPCPALAPAEYTGHVSQRCVNVHEPRVADTYRQGRADVDEPRAADLDDQGCADIDEPRTADRDGQGTADEPGTSAVVAMRRG